MKILKGAEVSAKIQGTGNTDDGRSGRPAPKLAIVQVGENRTICPPDGVL